MVLLLQQQGSEQPLGAERLQQLQMAQVQLLLPFGAPTGEAGRFIRTWPLRHAGTPGRRAKGAAAKAADAAEAAEAAEAEEAVAPRSAEQEADEVFLDAGADEVMDDFLEAVDAVDAAADERLRLIMIVFVGSHLLTGSVKRSRFVLAKAERDEIASVKMGSLWPATHTGTCCFP